MDLREKAFYPWFYVAYPYIGIYVCMYVVCIYGRVSEWGEWEMGNGKR
jgi:hypothetical protein